MEELIPRIFEFGIHLPDKLKNLIPPHFFNGAGDEMLGKELPGLPQFGEKSLDIQADGALVFLISLGEYEAKGNLPFAEVLYKLQVKFLRGMTAVDQYKDRDQIFTFADILGPYPKVAMGRNSRLG